MSTKAGWDRPASAPTATLQVDLPFATETVIRRARSLTTAEIDALDAADRTGGQARIVAWELLRDVVDRQPDGRSRRFAARRLAWQAVNDAAAVAGLDHIADDDDWRVIRQPGAGAARLARYAACALLAPELLDEVVADLLVERWLAVVG